MPVVINNELVFGGVVTGQELAEKYGTPLEVMEWDVVEGKMKRWNSALKLAREIYPDVNVGHQHLVAGKAHYTRPLHEAITLPMGFGVDTTSREEVEYFVDVIGFDPSKIVYTGNGVKPEELEYIAEKGVYPNLESEQAVRLFNEIAPGTEISVRVKPGKKGGGFDTGRDTGRWESKFGIPYFDIQRVIEQYAGNLTVNGVHTHMGSGAMDADTLAARDEFVMSLHSRLKQVNRFNFGGGIKIPYHRGIHPLHSWNPDQKEVDIEEYAMKHMSIVAAHYQEIGNHLLLNHENGRWFYAEAGTVLGRITDIKRIPNGSAIEAFLTGTNLDVTDMSEIPYKPELLVSVDFGWENCAREFFYGPDSVEDSGEIEFMKTAHLIMPVKELDRRPTMLCDITGRICESEIDQGTNRYLPGDTKIGDIVAKLNYGAYGPSSMALLLYNMYGQMRQVAVYRGDVFETRPPMTVRQMVANNIPWSEIREHI